MAELENTFSVAVVEAYGMTEASHQISTNPLPPRQRKPGSIGLPAGTEVGIMDTTGNLLARGIKSVKNSAEGIILGFVGAAAMGGILAIFAQFE